MKLRILWCEIAEKHHKDMKRQYAHMGHIDNIICVCRAFYELPPSHYYGILAHEIGHHIAAVSGFRPKTYEEGELAADHAIEQQCEILVEYASTDYGDNLQYLVGKDIQKLLKCIQFI